MWFAKGVSALFNGCAWFVYQLYMYIICIKIRVFHQCMLHSIPCAPLIMTCDDEILLINFACSISANLKFAGHSYVTKPRCTDGLKHQVRSTPVVCCAGKLLFPKASFPVQMKYGLNYSETGSKPLQQCHPILQRHSYAQGWIGHPLQQLCQTTFIYRACTTDSG